MEGPSERLSDLVQKYLPMLTGLSEADFFYKVQGKWSRAEELGHLIDSAQNNIRRFIVSGYERVPQITYNQDKWVIDNNYGSWKKEDLIAYWSLINQQVGRIISSLDSERTAKKCHVGTNDSDHCSVGWLIEDYIAHLQHHVHRILNLHPVNYGVGKY